MDVYDNICNKLLLYHIMETKYVAVYIRISALPNISVMSGFRLELINLFCEQWLDTLQSYTHCLVLVKSLANEIIYKNMNDKLYKIV